ncbi:MAG: LytTR family DNA-binding domain-containing protein [Gammaproteobacteria bacterium]
MRILVVDDEALARARMQRMLEAIGGYTVCGEAANGNEALSMTEQSQPDVLLMDIRMPVMDGLEAARHLQVLDQPPAIIFTTAYNDYALPAFETHAVDYLLKPVRQERLADALQHARRLTRAQAAALKFAGDSQGARQHICARVRGGLQLIPVGEIRYFQADQKYVTVCTATGHTLIEETLKSLEDEFAGQFMRIHRNALIAPRYLAGLEKTADGHCRVQLQDVDAALEVSRRHVAAVRKLVKAL